MAERDEQVLKILVVGDLHTGKTSFIKRYVEGTFSDVYKSTIGLDFATKQLTWNFGPGSSVDLQLHFWDIGGQERYRAVTHVYYKEADGALLVYDLSKPETFPSAVESWKADIDAKVRIRPEDPDSPPIPVVLLANKYDLLKQENEPDEAKMKTFCQEHNFLGWFKTSAKLNTNLERAVNCLLTEIMKEERITENLKKDVLRLNNQRKNDPPSQCAC
eukprot:TRINITY_DN6248_c0_g3_i1.p1 TRINITY_DN6248_c0_g3~~TRINITY_DN6248_c0_g3_i1.p1  ORF type:complete len:217 (+),score=56.69 TRINITY_DN6248_c0_g3_i1:46-696(+)